jgi:protein-tyrosine phosphatase
LPFIAKLFFNEVLAMIDLHSHILFGVDDGSKDETMTVEMLKIAENDGIKLIVATLHYIHGANKYTSRTLDEKFEYVAELTAKNNIGIKFILGNEIFLDEYAVCNCGKPSRR